jgi:hypothetical protein
MDFISTWADAIARFEGFYSAGSRPQRNNNPGDLKFAGQAGAIGKDAAGFAIFPDAATGFQALYNQLNKYVRDFPGYSILEIMAHYLGQGSTPTSDSEGNAFQYADSVAGALGVPADTTLAALANPATAAPAPAAPDAASGDTTATDVSTDPNAPDGGQILGMAIAGGLVFWALTRWLN